MSPISAIGDIQGELSMLKHVLELIEADGRPAAFIVFLWNTPIVGLKVPEFWIV